MEGLRRDPSAVSDATFDVVIIGGGIYGAMAALEAARRGLCPLLLERDDFGGATSWNSHRIVHGGLRYLQSLDLGRFRTSVRERRWFLQHFPDLVEPLPCLMPLYGQGARRPEIMRAALIANNLLSRHRNDGLRPDRRLASGGVMTVPETLSLFPAVRQERLRGGALWYDAVMRDSQRLLMEVLRWACTYGARCLNYAEATSLMVERGRVSGVEVRLGEHAGGGTLSVAAPVVINCAGPWSAALAASLDRAVDGMFRPSLAFNLLFDREPPAEVALAVSPPPAASHTWFLYPRSGCTYVGTAHSPHSGSVDSPSPSPQQIDNVIDQVNASVPALELRRHQVLRVYAGFLPAAAADSAELSDRPVIHDHAAAGGPVGLFSVSGVKYTTARDVAETTLRRAFPDLAVIGEDTDRPPPAALPELPTEGSEIGEQAAAAWRAFAADEAVVQLDDLLLRRGSWADNPRRVQAIEGALGAVFTRRP